MKKVLKWISLFSVLASISQICLADSLTNAVADADPTALIQCTAICAWFPENNDPPGAGAKLWGGNDPCDGDHNGEVLHEASGVRCEHLDGGTQQLSGICTKWEDGSVSNSCAQYALPDCGDPAHKGMSFKLYARQKLDSSASWFGISSTLTGPGSIADNKYTCPMDEPETNCANDPSGLNCDQSSVPWLTPYIQGGVSSLDTANTVLNGVDRNRQAGGLDMNSNAKLYQGDTPASSGMLTQMNALAGGLGTQAYKPNPETDISGLGRARSNLGNGSAGQDSSRLPASSNSRLSNLFGGDNSFETDSGFSLGSGVNTQEASLSDEEINSIYSKGRGQLGKNANSNGGAAIVPTPSLFVRGPASGVDVTGSEDPSNYFSRIHQNESIFRKIEKRYRETSTRWNAIDRALQKKVSELEPR